MQPQLNKLDYTLKGKKDAYPGNIILETSLKHLMSLQTVDFMEEQTLFQYHPMEDFLASGSSTLQSVILRLRVRALNRCGVARRVAISVSEKYQRASFVSQRGSA